MATNSKSEVISHDPVSDEAQAKLAALFEKYIDLCTNADSLVEPFRSIAKFVKKEATGEGKDGDPT